MIIPEGLTVNIGRREYRSGDTLPANAPESVKKRCADKAAELAKKDKAPEKPPTGNNPPQGNSGT